MLASGLVAGLLKVALVAVSLGGLTAGAYYAYQIGPGGSSGVSGQLAPTISATVSPTIAPATPSPTAEPSTPTPKSTVAPTALPTATQVVPTVDPDCAKTANNHLNIAKLEAHPNLTGAVITEIDDNSILILFEGVEAIVEGRGDLVLLSGRDLSRGQRERLAAAIDAVLYAC